MAKFRTIGLSLPGILLLCSHCCCASYELLILYLRTDSIHVCLVIIRLQTMLAVRGRKFIFPCRRS